MYNPEDMINRPPIPQGWIDSLIKGEAESIRFISRLAVSTISLRKNKTCLIAIDGHLGVPWKVLIAKLDTALRRLDLKPDFHDLAHCLKSPKSLEKALRPYLPEDPTFGRIYSGKLVDFFDKRKILSLQKKLRLYGSTNSDCPVSTVVICYGIGAAGLGLRRYYDAVFYVDLCREEILKRLKMGTANPIGTKPAPLKTKKSSEDALPAYFSTRRFYYVDYPVLDKHRKRLLPKVGYYIDGNLLNTPKLLPGNVFHQILDLVTSGPVKPKPYYDPSPWGGQWLKRIRKLPRKMVNCAWSYDLIEPETSVLVAIGKTYLEIPFPVLTCRNPERLLGTKGSKKKFRGQFPIRINYDDSYEGGDMALQCHPNDAYIKEHFGEPYRQDESYYVVDSAPGSKVYLGLKEEADVGAFRTAVVRAEKNRIPFDHNKYVNSLPSETGNLFLIPAGTLHASGKNETVLEISATTYRYTFHFYDYLRPGLDGSLRPIHSKHAFAALKTYRRSRWIKDNLKRKPRIVRKGKDWVEYLLGSRSDMFFKVHRLEFNDEVHDNTRGEFHLLVVVAGERIRICPHLRPELTTELPFSCLSVIPAAMGPYKLIGLGHKPFKVVKVLMR
jgi:mannose-6-phosphate isomerase